nr:MAG TPA: hypothetical protein [Caudoviricetes sp.]
MLLVSVKSNLVSFWHYKYTAFINRLYIPLTSFKNKRCSVSLKTLKTRHLKNEISDCATPRKCAVSLNALQTKPLQRKKLIVPGEADVFL